VQFIPIVFLDKETE